MRTLALSLSFVICLSAQRSLWGQGLDCPPPDSVAGLGAVVGQVLDAQTQVPLGFTQVRIRIGAAEAPLETRADAMGRFRFCVVPAGAFTISGQMGQLGARQGPQPLRAGESLRLTLELAPPTTGSNTGTVTGLVVEMGSKDPLEGATVELPDLGQTAITNANGRFTFPSLPPGEVKIVVNRLGFAEATGEVEVLVGQQVRTQVTLSTEPIALDAIEVTAVRQRIVLPGFEEFERRFNSGWGEFVLEEDIQQRRPTKLTDMLHETGVEVLGDGDAIWIRRSMCAPLVYIDDVKVTYLPRAGPFTRAVDGGRLRLPKKSVFKDPDADPKAEAADAVNNLVHPMDVVAIEVYKGPAETPGQYIDSNSKCGVILIWTRRGNISGGG